MDEGEKIENKKTNDECIDREQKLIIEMIYKVDNIGTLEYLHTFIKLFLEKWG